VKGKHVSKLYHIRYLLAVVWGRFLMAAESWNTIFVCFNKR